jgi:hypothetical protein
LGGGKERWALADTAGRPNALSRRTRIPVAVSRKPRYDSCTHARTHVLTRFGWRCPVAGITWPGSEDSGLSCRCARWFDGRSGWVVWKAAASPSEVAVPTFERGSEASVHAGSDESTIHHRTAATTPRLRPIVSLASLAIVAFGGVLTFSRRRDYANTETDRGRAAVARLSEPRARGDPAR